MTKKKKAQKHQVKKHTSNPDAASALAASLKAGETDRAKNALKELLIAHPTKWRQIISRMKEIPDPARPGSDPFAATKMCSTLSASAKALKEEGVLGPKNFHWIVSLSLAITDFAQRFESIRRALDTRETISDSLPTLTYRLGIRMEHQSRMVHRTAIERGVVGGRLDPYVMIRNEIDAPTGTRMNLLDAYERLIECSELILRDAHYRAKKTGARRDEMAIKSPFHDPDLETTLHYAGAWKWFESVLGAVRFADWIVFSDAKEGIGYLPAEVAEHRRYRVGQIREGAVLAQFSPQLFAIGEYSDSHELGKIIADQLTLPQAGNAWDGKLPIAEFEKYNEHTFFEQFALAWIDFRSYGPLLNKLKLPARDLTWQKWIWARNRLDGIAKILAIATDAGDEDLESIDWNRCVVVTKKQTLAELLRKDGVLTRAQAVSAIDLLTFAQERQNLELWDQPLLPLGEDRLLIVPSLIASVNVARSLENYIQEWSRDTHAFSVRGVPFEIRVRNDIAESCPGLVQRNIKFGASDGREVEFDILWWWDGYLFLIESKCICSVHSFAEFRGAKGEVEEAIEQLERRRKVVHADWATMRREATELSLPAEIPEDARIVTIAVTNILSFTSWIVGQTVITDNICFMRYFGESEVAVYHASVAGSQEVGVVGQIRGPRVSPSEFVEYLRHPPQCKIVEDALVETPAYLPSVTEDDLAVWQYMLEYEGSPLTSAAQNQQ